MLKALLAAIAAVLLSGGALAEDAEALWKRLQEGGYVLLIRHAATEPGFGDPAQFRIGDCSTQRNLSEAGREEARRLGEAFRSRRIPIAEVRSSLWCRCRDTARIAFGDHQPWPALNSLHHEPAAEERQRRELLAGLAGGAPRGNLVLVTHNFNVRSLLKISPATAEIVVARYVDGDLQLVGRIPAP